MATKKENTEMTFEQMQAAMLKMLEDAKAEAAKIADAAKAEAAKIVAEAKASTEPNAISEEEKAKMYAYWDEPVEVKLFKDKGKYSDDHYVGVNGKRYQIKRGERVKIPRKFAAVLDASDLQDYETAKLIERESSGDKFAGTV